MVKGRRIRVVVFYLVLILQLLKYFWPVAVAAAAYQLYRIHGDALFRVVSGERAAGRWTRTSV